MLSIQWKDQVLLSTYTANGWGLLFSWHINSKKRLGLPDPSLRKDILLFCFKQIIGFLLSTYTQCKSHCLLNSLVLCRIVSVKLCSLPMSYLLLVHQAKSFIYYSYPNSVLTFLCKHSRRFQEACCDYRSAVTTSMAPPLLPTPL